MKIDNNKIEKSDLLASLALSAVAVFLGWMYTGLASGYLKVPLEYSGDALQVSYMIQNSTPWGGFSDIIAAGAPFGTQHYDFPLSDTFNLVLAKLLFQVDGFGQGFNLYVLVSFALTTFSGFLVARAFGISRLWSTVVATAFTFLPFHFFRLGHLFYLNYSTAAIALWIGLRIQNPLSQREDIANFRRFLTSGNIVFVTACLYCGITGVYYGFFSCIVIGAAILFGIGRSTFRSGVLKRGTAALAIIVVVTTLQLMPSKVFQMDNGANPSVAARGFEETEVYGLKITQLLLPQPNHPIKKLSNLTQRYSSASPNTNENMTATLGTIGTIGFLMLLLSMIVRRWNYSISRQAQYLAVATLVMLLYATVSGVGALFSLVVTPDLRGLNRISPFIAFASLCFLGLNLDKLRIRRDGLVSFFILVPFGLFIIWDQVPFGRDSRTPQIQASIAQYVADRDFAKQVEKAVPKHATVLQLPYNKYPESVESLPFYAQFRNFLHAPGIQWTYGAMKGRPEADFLERLSNASPDDFVKQAGQIGYAAVVVDQRGRTPLITEQINALAALGPIREIHSSDNSQVAYVIPSNPTLVDRPMLAESNFYAQEFANGEYWNWSNGRRSMIEIAGPPANSRTCKASITLVSPNSRTVTIAVDGAKELSQQLSPNIPVEVKLSVPAQSRYIHISTNQPPVVASESDPRLIAYRWKHSGLPVCDLP